MINSFGVEIRIYKFEKLEPRHAQRSYEIRATHTKHYLANNYKTRADFAIFSGMHPSNKEDRDFVEFGESEQWHSRITEIEVF